MRRLIPFSLLALILHFPPSLSWAATEEDKWNAVQPQEVVAYAKKKCASPACANGIEDYARAAMLVHQSSLRLALMLGEPKMEKVIHGTYLEHMTLIANQSRLLTEFQNKLRAIVQGLRTEIIADQRARQNSGASVPQAAVPPAVEIAKSETPAQTPIVDQSPRQKTPDRETETPETKPAGDDPIHLAEEQIKAAKQAEERSAEEIRHYKAAAAAMAGKIDDKAAGEAAKDYFGQRIKENPTDFDAFLARSFINAARGDCEAARSDAGAVLGLQPDNKQAFAVSNLCHGTIAAKAPAMSAGFPSAPLERGQEGIAPATKVLPQAIGAAARPPASPLITSAGNPLQNAYRFYEIKDYRTALLEASRAIAADRNNPRAWALRAAISNRLKNYAGALKDATEALKLDPKNVQALIERGYAEYNLGDLAHALEDLNQALALSPGDPMGHLYRAMVLEKQGKNAEALKDYEEAARLDVSLQPLLEDALKRLGGPTGSPPVRALPRRLLFQGGLMVLALSFIILGLMGTAAGRRVTTGAFRLLTRKERGEPGEKLLGGNYRIIGELGRGGMGIVYEAFDTALQRRVAIKQLQGGPESTPEDRERLLKEARLVAKLNHPHLAEIHNVIDEGDLYLVFEHVEGRTLHELISERGRLSLSDARDFLAQICGALEYAHGRNIIHRDLKPSNIMATPEGVCKVMDFGIAHQAQTMSRVTQTAASGTPPYMAPEQLLGEASQAVDIYALGVMAYEMLTGRLPFPGPDFQGQKLREEFGPVRQAEPSLPTALDAFFALVLRADPAKRPTSAGRFLKAFDDACVATPT